MHLVLNDDDRAVAALLPRDRPFLTTEALDLGLTPRQIARLVAVGLLRRPFRGVYFLAETEDDITLRFDVLRLVVPEHCVVTDRSAGWVWVGDRILAPNAHLETPPLSVFCRPGHRLRSKLTDSGERTFLDHDLVEVGGLVLTTPLRTACDLGRLLTRDQAFAALDTLAATGAFTVERLIAEAQRFKRYRGVRQLRAFVVLVDPRSESQGESILRLRWYDAGLPRPRCQVEVETPWGTTYRLDIGLEELLLAAEYDGEQFHGEDAKERDKARRTWLAEERGWLIEVARKDNIYGPSADIHNRLWNAWKLAKLRTALTRP